MLVNTTVSHISPLLYYIPRSAWYEATLQSDSNILSYPNASYHATNFTTSGSASVSFSWYGKGLWAFGGYRSYLGPYKVTLDGNTTTYDGYTGGPDQYAFQLFGIMDLPVGQHHLRITNTGVDPARPTLDLDYLIFEGETDSAVTVDHTSDKCVWSPQSAGAWVVDEFTHTTSLASGQMGMNFTGTGIAVYGSLDVHSAPLSVSVDGASSPPLAPNTAVLSPIMNVTTLLYVKTGLLQGTHEMLVENDPVSSGTNATATRMSIASVVVFSDVDAGEHNPDGTDAAPPTQTSMSPKSTKIFAASFGTLGVILLLVLTWRLIVLYRRRAVRHADAITARPFMAPTGPYSAGSEPPLSSHPVTAILRERERAPFDTRGQRSGPRSVPPLLEPLRRPPSTTHAPEYSAVATAPFSPDSPSPWPPAVRRPRSTDKPPRQLVLQGSPVPTSLPSARMLPQRDRPGAYEFLKSPREAASPFAETPTGGLAPPQLPSQMPPPYRFLDLH